MYKLVKLRKSSSKSNEIVSNYGLWIIHFTAPSHTMLSFFGKSSDHYKVIVTWNCSFSPCSQIPRGREMACWQIWFMRIQTWNPCRHVIKLPLSCRSMCASPQWTRSWSSPSTPTQRGSSSLTRSVWYSLQSTSSYIFTDHRWLHINCLCISLKKKKKRGLAKWWIEASSNATE